MYQWSTFKMYHTFHHFKLISPILLHFNINHSLWQKKNCGRREATLTQLTQKSTIMYEIHSSWCVNKRELIINQVNIDTYHETMHRKPMPALWICLMHTWFLLVSFFLSFFCYFFFRLTYFHHNVKSLLYVWYIM
jgi:hypothetical protein